MHYQPSSLGNKRRVDGLRLQDMRAPRSLYSPELKSNPTWIISAHSDARSTYWRTPYKKSGRTTSGAIDRELVSSYATHPNMLHPSLLYSIRGQAMCPPNFTAFMTTNSQRARGTPSLFHCGRPRPSLLTVPPLLPSRESQSVRQPTFQLDRQLLNCYLHPPQIPLQSQPQSNFQTNHLTNLMILTPIQRPIHQQLQKLPPTHQQMNTSQPKMSTSAVQGVGSVHLRSSL